MTGQRATPETTYDMLHFRAIGEKDYKAWITFHYQRSPSAQVSYKYRRLQTFSTSKALTQKAKRIGQEKKVTDTCLRKQIMWTKLTGEKLEEACHQLTELPRALVDEDGLPVKGNKSKVITTYTNRYGEQLASTNLPDQWTANSVIIDGMFLLHITPQSEQTSLSQYYSMLATRHILPFYKSGALEVHLIFDDPDRLSASPKAAERQRRYQNADADHTHYSFQMRTSTKLKVEASNGMHEM